jgi:Peptidase family C25/Propeptide_C25/FlgD Ig-like domain
MPSPSHTRDGASRARALTFAGLAILLAWLDPARSLAQPAGIIAGPAAGTTIRFLVEVPAPVLTPLKGHPLVSVLTVAGFDPVGRPGTPLLPERVVWVAVPPTGDVTVTAVETGSIVRENVQLALQPMVRRSASSTAPEQGTPMAPGAIVSRPVPRPSARLLGVRWVRDQRVAVVAIAPARYDPVARRLEMASRLDVMVAPSGASLPTGAGLTPVDSTASAGAFETIYRAGLVNYEQGRHWRARNTNPERVTRTSRIDRVAQAEAVPDTSIYVAHGWIKISVTHAGFYKLTWSQLRNSAIFLANPNPEADSLRMVTWPGYPVLPEANYCDSCDYREVAMQVQAGNVHQFGVTGGDNILFYALGASDWGKRYDPTRPDTEFVNHPYETRNYYYLTIATTKYPMGGTPLRIATPDASIGDTTTVATPATFPDRLHLELDTDYEPDATPNDNDTHFDVSGTRTGIFWEKWFWRSIKQGETFPTDPFNLPGYDTLQTARVRALYWGIWTLAEGEFKSYTIRDHYLDVSVNSLVFPERGWDGRRPQIYDTTMTMKPTGNQVFGRVPLVTDPLDPGRADLVALGWVDVFYPRFFQPVNDQLAFDSPGHGDVLYNIGPFSAGLVDPPMVFDITNPLAPIQLMGADWSPSGAGHRLRFRVQETGPRRYLVLPPSAVTQPFVGEFYDAPASSYENLRGRGKKADYLLIYYDGFRPAADALLRWRRDHLPVDDSLSAPYDTASVPISALYDQFSGGRTDPTAIRNFLRTIFLNWTKRPLFVTLLGGTTYDFKNIAGQAPSGQPGALLPSWENGFDNNIGRQFDTDDWLLDVQNPAIVIPDFIGARIPARDAAAALSYVQGKLIPYESTAPPGPWRNEVMLIADDDQQPPKPDPLGWTHVQNSAQLDTLAIPRHEDRNYVYLHTYASETTCGSGTYAGLKPCARDAIISGINNGIGMVNYVGHGSPYKIADESVYLDGDAAAAKSGPRPTVFCAASCDVGKFSNPPPLTSIGEDLLMNSAGGAVAVVSATELAFSFQNQQMNLALMQGIFHRSPRTGRYSQTLSASLLATKGNVNNSKFLVMGDAAARLLLPNYPVEITMTDSAGTPVTQVARGHSLYIHGRVLDKPGGSVVPFDGNADLLFEESAPIDTVPDCDPVAGDCVEYPFRAAPIFRGDSEIRAGLFTARCVVPVDAHVGKNARARAYVTDAAGTFGADGVGSTNYSMVAGSIPGNDHSGPSISLAFAGGSTTVRRDATLHINLDDPSGILITGHIPRNGIVVTVDDLSTQRFDATTTFRYATGSATSGAAVFVLPGLAVGPHRISVGASDNLAAGINAEDHRSNASIDFTVSENPTLNVTRAILFPNPIRSSHGGGGGTFVVDVPGDSVNVLLKIYTVGGKLIRVLEHFGGQGQVQIPWDGLDAQGDPLANGTYLYHVHVNPRDPDGSSSAQQTANAEGRLVVVGH